MHDENEKQDDEYQQPGPGEEGSNLPPTGPAESAPDPDVAAEPVQTDAPKDPDAEPSEDQ